MTQPTGKLKGHNLQGNGKNAANYKMRTKPTGKWEGHNLLKNGMAQPIGKWEGHKLLENGMKCIIFISSLVFCLITHRKIQYYTYST